MKTRRALVTVILVAMTVLGGGCIGIASIGTSVADARNNDLPRFNATARCRDGTWTWSKQPDAPSACSQHGGVAL